MKTIYLFIFSFCLLAACQEKDILQVDTAYRSLNILKGEYGDVKYPESYSFNAYFLGVGADDYTLTIPVRLSGLIDFENDRSYRVRVNPEKSQHVEAGVQYSLDTLQTFRKGLAEDSILLVIHVGALNETDDYKIYLELIPGETFKTGIKELQFIEIDFMKNVNTPPLFWTNNSKLAKLTYHPRKCIKFLEISKITDPKWSDPGNSVIVDYWIQVATQWFLDHEEYDENNNRIYFDE